MIGLSVQAQTDPNKPKQRTLEQIKQVEKTRVDKAKIRTDANIVRLQARITPSTPQADKERLQKLIDLQKANKTKLKNRNVNTEAQARFDKAKAMDAERSRRKTPVRTDR